MAGIQNDDPACTDDRGKSVGNHNYCPFSAAAPVGADPTSAGRHAPLREFHKGFLDQRLVLGIGKSRCLVQHYDRRILQNCTCQCHTLLLASGQVCAFGADHGINAVRQLFNNVIALCGGEGFQYFFPGSIRPRCPHIFQNRCLEQVRVLEHKSHLIHQHMGVGLPDIHTSDFNRAGTHIPETRDEACRRGLPAAGGTDQSDRLSRFDTEGNMIQCRKV